MLSINRILVLSPHTDDGEIAAGGTIVRFVEEHREVFYAAFSSCEISVPSGLPGDVLKKECQQATGILGILPQNLILLDYEARTFPLYRQQILDEMIKLAEDIKPNLVLIPSSNDIHQDHQTIHKEALRAFKKSSSIWGYEHAWNNFTFTADVFLQLKEEYLRRKIDALKQYRSQDFRPYFDEKYITGLAYMRGMQANFTFAEAYELLRLLVN